MTQAPVTPAPVTPTSPTASSEDWERIVREQQQRVYRLSYRLTGNAADAEDLTHDVFVRIFRSLDSYTEGNFDGWVTRITMNLFRDRWRRRKRILIEAVADDDLVALGTASPSSEDAWTDSTLDVDVRAALAALPPAYRDAVVLCDVDGMGYEQAAEVLGVKLGTVRSRLHRGRALLRESLAHRQPVRPRQRTLPSLRPGALGAA
ncbi:RNA polymerase RpoE-like sigma-24 subunit [Motilibacter rhizosphaerae]|uniref:RNA polymerase RpoE-like sigma-24 subunit n=1 Tax=Motilibacter rhizosphaerae TaxID=598652 RepID=A0A4Q7NP40_9ACTN|nr:sigma-70 family RNA polymerase sigma factor [Motilibacter rhizosphaerae]RZS86788.1 RNA polymerase RpoE-like sigma-24 subunit [Motilibacter rhizosphaerae]